jgi:cytochrome c-type biogenesis protein
MTISLWLAFLAGLLSFISPCTLPLFPSYLGYISGVSFAGQQGASRVVRLRALLHALCFCLGLSILFVLLGWGATSLGVWLRAYEPVIRVVGGGMVVLMGLFMAGVWQSTWLSRERRIQLPAERPLGYLGSFLVGVIFAAGWTPCIGPILGAVLALVVTHPTIGTWYMVTYAIGFAVPFLVFAVTLTSLRPLYRYTEPIARVGGWLLVIMGLLLITNETKWITIWLQQATGWNGL